jgi:glycosyltransferase involved in cell wall biosynthesis
VELRARVVDSEWTGARDCTIHFINRVWAWSDGVLDRVHSSNKLLGLWWHGTSDTPDAKMQSALRRLQRLHGRFARVQVTCSSGRNTLLAAGVPPEKIVQLPEGVDLQIFRRAVEQERRTARGGLGIPESALAVGCFQKDGEGWGAGDEPKLVKGPDVFADAMVIAHRHYPVHVVLPGPSRGYIKKRLSSAGIPFTAPGFVPRSQIAYLYHALDMYVSPSRDEGGPAGVLEAMAGGIPVVSTRSGMAADIIVSGRNGLLVPIDNADALADAVSELAASPVQMVTFRERALATIADYDWPVLAKRYAEELYSG